MEASLQQVEQFQNNKIKGCILPWIHLHGNINGDFKVCCFVEGEESARTIGNYQQPLLDIFNGDQLNSVRKAFLKGDIPTECDKVCYSKERLGDTSNRISKNQEYKKWADIQNSTDKDGSVSHPPIYLDIRFGNLCNFKCRMCGPESSTSWYRESDSWTEKKAIDRYTNNEIFWDSLEDVAPTLVDVYFAGGEPFVQDGHYKLLNYLINNGYASKINLQYNSNLSYERYKDYDIMELWSKFSSVKVWPSCEGFGERGEYSRKGLSTETFKSNVLKYKKYIQTISVVGSIWSITNLPELIIWCKTNNIFFYITTLINPDHASLTVLPRESKSKINSMYKKFLTEYKDKLTYSEIQNILQMLSYMNGRDDSHLLSEFIQFNKRLDLSRNESFPETFPEFRSWYENI